MSVLSGAALAIDLFVAPVNLTRFTASGWSNGQFNEDASPSTIPVMAVIQAPSERDMRLLPEGERIEAYVVIWSRSEMRVADEATGIRADIVTGHDGATYRLVRMINRAEAGYYRAIARKEVVNAGRHL
jgi:hypothetical protein